MKISIKFILIYFIVIFISCLLISSCKKIDSFPNDDFKSIDLSERFLRLPANADPTLLRIQNSLKNRNDKFPFINRVAHKMGLPVWEKPSL